MILDINIDKELSVVRTREVSDIGTKRIKNVPLEEFIQKYASMVKEKDEDKNFLFFPPGTVEFFKNVNSYTYVVHTYNYREYYGVDEADEDYLIIMKTNLDCSKIILSKVYSTRGAFNKHLSSFKNVYICEDIIDIADEEAGIKKCVEMISEKRKKSIALKQKYNKII